jgi:hypothetical protein
MTFNLAMRQRLAVGFMFDDAIGALNAGIYYDHPAVSGTLETVEDVDTKCQPLASSSAANKDKIKSILKAPLKVTFDAGYHFGVDVLAQVS